MSELKTLKDIILKANKKSIVNQELLDLIIMTYNEILKAEAVKWVKEMQGIMYDNELHYSTEWIKHFFNLNEEELRE